MMAAKRTVIEAKPRKAPGKMERTKPRSGAHAGRRGCGVERSLLPHCEQASAVRGFICLRGQSFQSNERPQELQNQGFPGVMRLQLKQNFIGF